MVGGDCRPGSAGQQTREDSSASRARAGRADLNMNVLQMRRNKLEKSEADDHGTRRRGRYFRTKNGDTGGSGEYWGGRIPRAIREQTRGEKTRQVVGRCFGVFGWHNRKDLSGSVWRARARSARRTA